MAARAVAATALASPGDGFGRGCDDPREAHAAEHLHGHPRPRQRGDALQPRERREAARRRRVLLARPRPARRGRLRDPPRRLQVPSARRRGLRAASGSARSSTTTTTSSSSSSTAPSPTTTGWSRCTASTPSASSSPSTATTRPAFAEIRAALREARRSRSSDPSLLLYRIIDGLVDSFFPILADFDDRIDELEDAIFLQRRRRAAPGDLPDEAAARRHAQGDHARSATRSPRLMGGVAELPGMTDEDERYFRDIYDHLIRISDLIDSYRDLLTGAMDVYLSTVSNRLNTRHEAADDHRDHLPAAHLSHRLLRPELRLDGPPHRRLGSVRRPRHRHRARRRRRRCSPSSSGAAGSEA